jgi:hypothetical protein
VQVIVGIPHVVGPICCRSLGRHAIEAILGGERPAELSGALAAKI